MAETVLVAWNEIHPCQCHKVAANHERHCLEEVKAWICDTCGSPFVPKHWEARYSTCQKCHYGM